MKAGARGANVMVRDLDSGAFNLDGRRTKIVADGLHLSEHNSVSTRLWCVPSKPMGPPDARQCAGTASTWSQHAEPKSSNTQLAGRGGRGRFVVVSGEFLRRNQFLPHTQVHRC